MAEAAAAIGLAASIVQLLHLGTEVIGRLHDYRTKSKETPAVFHDISVQLPLLVADLRVTRERAERNGLPSDVTESVSAIVKSCGTHIRILDDILIRTMPDPTDSAWKTGKKVILSFRQEEKVRLVAEKLRSYVIYLTHHAATNNFQDPVINRGAVSQNDEQFRMLQWLSNDDPSISHNRAVQKKQHGSGQWFLESTQFSQWRSSTHTFAWLYGIPGCGKTILCSTIIEGLQEVLEADTSSTIAYWYFDFDNASSLNVSNMLRSLIKQLCFGETILPDAVQEMCAKYRASGHQPTTKILLTTLHSAIDSIRKKTFLVLDALDEYPESRRQELLAAIRLLRDSEHGDIHVLVTSRREYDIEHMLNPITTQEVSIEGLVVDDDIRTHVRASLTEDARLCRLSPSMKETIEVRLVQSAQGMFRWVECQLDTLRACNKVSAIKKSLDQLPHTLDETYDRILKAIDPADAVEAYHILRWLAFAERPLTLEEVAEAAVTKGDGDPIDTEDRLFDPYDVTRICKSLVSITKDTVLICDRWTSGNFVRFAHFSVKEYLLSFRVSEGKAKAFHLDTQSSHQQIGLSCLSVLLHNDEMTEEQQPPLVQYAAEYWFVHLQRLKFRTNSTAVSKRLVERLFVNSPRAFRKWLLVYDVNIRRGLMTMILRQRSHPNPLYYAAFLGLEDAVRPLLTSKADIDAKGGRYGTALIAAASQGHLAIVQLLLDNGADVDAEGGYSFFTALQACSYFGYKSIAELLLNRGAQPDRRRENDDTALELACEAGHVSVVELLIERGSDVNLYAGGYGYPLIAAVERNQHDVVSLLLRKGAKVNNEGGLYSTALQAAASAGSESIVQLLLDNGADVNVYGGVFGDPLRASSIRGHHTIVKILLEHGASIAHLLDLLLESTSEASKSGIFHTNLAQEMKSALDTGAPISQLAALVKQAHFQLRSHETESRTKQATAVPRPHLDRLRKLVKQAVQSDFDRHRHSPQSRFYNAAMEIRAPPTPLLLPDRSEQERR